MRLHRLVALAALVGGEVEYVPDERSPEPRAVLHGDPRRLVRERLPLLRRQAALGEGQEGTGARQREDASARFEAAEATSTKVTFHTPPYAAIEQYVKTYPQGPWTDIYALGVVLYECITGQKPPEVLERLHAGLGEPFSPTPSP